jgi:hypothetical protein
MVPQKEALVAQLLKILQVQLSAADLLIFIGNKHFIIFSV